MKSYLEFMSRHLALEQNNFVLGIATDFWASVYKKRKTAAKAQIVFYDSAANINQISPNYGDTDHQDQVVKEIFRQFVDHVIQVTFV